MKGKHIGELVRQEKWWAKQTNKQANKQEIIKELPSWIKRKTI